MAAPQPPPPLSLATSLIAGGLLVMLAGQAYVRLTPPEYQATAIISLSRWTSGFEPGGAAEEKLAAEECAVAASGDNLRRVAQDLDFKKTWATHHPGAPALTEDAALAQLRQQVSVRPLPHSISLEIHAVSGDREEPAKIANDLAGIYTAWRSNQVNEVTVARISAYGRQNEEQSKKINEAKSRADELYLQVARERATNQNVYYDPEAYNYLITKVRERRVELESELAAGERQLTQYQVMNSSDLIQILSTTETNELLNSLLLQASHAKSALASVSQDHGEDAPEVKRAEAALVQLDGEIIRQVQAVLTRKAAEIASTKSAISNLDQKLKKASTNSLESAEHFAQYQNAKAELGRLEDAQSYLEKITTDSMRAKVEPFILNYTPTIIQPAETPTLPFVPDPTFGRLSLAGGLASVLAGLVVRGLTRRPGVPSGGKGKAA